MKLDEFSDGPYLVIPRKLMASFEKDYEKNIEFIDNCLTAKTYNKELNQITDILNDFSLEKYNKSIFVDKSHTKKVFRSLPTYSNYTNNDYYVSETPTVLNYFHNIKLSKMDRVHLIILGFDGYEYKLVNYFKITKSLDKILLLNNTLTGLISLAEL